MIQTVNNKLLVFTHRFLKLVEERPAYLFLFYFILSVVFRWQTFWKGELDHDISTYLVMANEWLKGHIPFVDYVDVKPPGIYALFALVIKLSGHFIFPVRILGAAFISLGAWGLHKCVQRLLQSASGALAGGILFIVAISAHKWAWAVNTEVFFVSFTAPALYFSLKKPTVVNTFIWGFILGLAFTIKYHIAFDALAIGLFYLIRNGKNGRFLTALLHVGSAALVFLLPMGLIVLWYYANGYIDELMYVVRDIPGRYQNTVAFADRLKFVSEFYLAFIPFSLLLLFNLGLFGEKRFREFGIFVTLWTICTWIAILITGKPFFHYYIQAIPPLVLSTVFVILFSENKISSLVRSYTPVLTTVLLLLLLITQNIQLRKYSMKGLLEMKEAISNITGPEDRIYVQQKNILYFLLDKSPPERYVHNSLMFSRDHIHAFGIDLQEESRRIAEAKPQTMLLLKDNPAYFSDLSAGYIPLDTFGNHWVLWSKGSIHSSIQH